MYYKQTHISRHSVLMDLIIGVDSDTEVGIHNDHL